MKNVFPFEAIYLDLFSLNIYWHVTYCNICMSYGSMVQSIPFSGMCAIQERSSDPGKESFVMKVIKGTDVVIYILGQQLLLSIFLRLLFLPLSFQTCGRYNTFFEMQEKTT